MKRPWKTINLFVMTRNPLNHRLRVSENPPKMTFKSDQISSIIPLNAIEISIIVWKHPLNFRNQFEIILTLHCNTFKRLLKPPENPWGALRKCYKTPIKPHGSPLTQFWILLQLTEMPWYFPETWDALLRLLRTSPPWIALKGTWNVPESPVIQLKRQRNLSEGPYSSWNPRNNPLKRLWTPFSGFQGSFSTPSWSHLKSPEVRPLLANYVSLLKIWLNLGTKFSF